MVDHEFFLSGSDPHFVLSKPYSDETFEEFCERTDFTAPLRFVHGFKEDDHEPMAQAAVNNYNRH